MRGDLQRWGLVRTARARTALAGKRRVDIRRRAQSPVERAEHKPEPVELLGCSKALPHVRPDHHGIEVPAVPAREPVPATIVAAALAIVVQRDGSCIPCGGGFMHAAHHVIAREDRGADHPSNLVALCANCHGRETAREQRERSR